MIPPEAMHPDALRAELAEAEQRAVISAGLDAKRKRRKWILIGAFVAGVTAVALAVALVLLFQVVGQLKQGQKNQAGASKSGLVLLEQVRAQGVTLTALAERLKDCTTPEGVCSQQQAKQAGTYVMNLQNSVLAGQAEELRRIGQLFTALGLTATQVQQITNNFPTTAAQQKAAASVPPAVTRTGGAPPSSTSTANCLATVNTPILRVDGTVCPP